MVEKCATAFDGESIDGAALCSFISNANGHGRCTRACQRIAFAELGMNWKRSCLIYYEKKLTI